MGIHEGSYQEMTDIYHILTLQTRSGLMTEDSFAVDLFKVQKKQNIIKVCTFEYFSTAEKIS